MEIWCHFFEDRHVCHPDPAQEHNLALVRVRSAGSG